MKWITLLTLLLAPALLAEPPNFKPVDGDRIVFLGGTLVDATQLRQQLVAYTEAIEKLSAKRGCGFVTLYFFMPPDYRWTEDGIHFTDRGAYAFGFTLLLVLTGKDTTTTRPSKEFEELRKLIIQKNREYFYRWRPQH